MPTSAATTYLWGRMYIDLGEYDLAANYFGRAAAAFYQTDPVMMAAQADLQYVLPPSVLEKGTAATYYLHIAELFGQVRRFDAVNRHCHLALIAATHEERAYGEHDSDLPKDLVEFKQTTWFKIFHSALDSRVYEEAYMAMMANPDERMRRDCLRHLVGVLCEEQGGKVTLLCRLGFPGLQDEVESNLLFKARNSDLFAHPNYYKILNSFHIFRGDYRAAASAMYQYAKRLGAALPYMQGDILEVTSKQAQAYLSCINSLQLVDSSSAWIVVSRQGPAVDGSGGKKRKKRRVEIERFNPKFGPASSGDRMQEQDLDIIELVDIRREYALALARLQLANKYPEFRTQNIQLDAEDAVILFVKAGMYDQAMSVSKTFGLDLDVVFQNLTRKCLSLAAQASEGRGELGLSGEEDDDAFWENEDVLEATGSPSEKAWCLLHSYLKRAEDPQAGGQLRYHYLVAETILKSETDFPLPPWLSAVLLKDRPQDLVRVCLRYGAITDATQFLIQHINSQVSQLSSPGYLAKTTCEFWLPYSLIDHTIRVLDSVIENVNAPEKGSPREFSERDDGPAGWRTLSVLREQLQSSLDTYMLYAKRESKDINHEINSSVPAAISAAMAMGV
ncbi:hypothetical protein EV182_004582 [Spiromyces aspiralis]|uniref:Uncharacterized protein n=1 Tax=Spiromyces aspiralis TaxID=68401 RepID=A0ACC1HQA2_9FUNG|nr:hypothetical protein EV182_004582 [Spiromyces aspiralis]